MTAVLQAAVSSDGSIDIDELAGRKLSIWDLLRFTLPTLGVWVINPILRRDPAQSMKYKCTTYQPTCIGSLALSHLGQFTLAEVRADVGQCTAERLDLQRGKNV